MHLKQLPVSIEKRLSSLPFSKGSKKLPYYEQYFSYCGCKENLNYCDPTPPNLFIKRKRQRNILWFSTPYSKTVKTKIGKFFFAANQKTFSKRT